MIMVGKFIQLFVLFHFILRTMDEITKEAEDALMKLQKQRLEKEK